MHLKRIELTNYRQHRQLDVDFDGNLIAIVARNGAGKSNLLGAIQYALTGEHPGATKTDLTTWGEKDGSVRLLFTAGSKNEEFVVTRKTNGDVTLKVGDETIKQARKVEEALREKAGLDKELIRQIVFVPQKGIDAILFDDPRNREIAFQKLIGIGDVSKIHEALRMEIAQYDRPQSFDEAIARSRQQLEEQEGVASKCREALNRYDEAIKTLPSKEALEGEVDKCARAQGTVSAYVLAEKSLYETKRWHEEAKEKLSGMGAASEEEESSLRAELEGIAKDRDELRAGLESGKESIRFLTRMKELSDAVTKANDDLAVAKANSELVHAKNPENTLAEESDEVRRLESEQVSAESELRSLNNLMRSASSDGTCPVCGAPASQEDIERHLRDRMSAAERTASEACVKAKEARRMYDIRKKEETAADREVERRQSVFDSAFAALKKAHDANVDGCSIDLGTFAVSFKGHTPDALPEIEANNADIEKRMAELDGKSEEVRKSLSAIEATKKQAKEARDNVARLAAQLDVLAENHASCKMELKSMGIDPESVKMSDYGACCDALKKARANMDAYNSILRDMAGTKGQLEAAEKTIGSTKKFIDDLLEKKGIEDVSRAKVDVLKRVREGLGYKEIPRILSQNVMHGLTSCVNSYLDQFNAPFVVEAEEEGFGFRCCFIDGRTMPDPHPDASLLSGGQKVALAIAFRMAIYMAFGGELGLLSLDEPTAYLDEASIGHLGELLEKVGAVARNKGLQILMATHEKAIMPFLDTKIDLDAMKKGE